MTNVIGGPAVTNDIRVGLTDGVQASRNTYTITWRLSNSQPFNLTGAILTGTFANANNENVYAITGVLTIVDAANGRFTWAVSAADVGTAGQYAVQFRAVIGGVSFYSFPVPWVVQPTGEANAVAAGVLVGISPEASAWLAAAMVAVGAAADGEIVQVDGVNLGGSGYLGAHSLRRNNYTAVVAPTVNDDTDDGYAPGSLWVDVTGDAAYLCVDATAGAAIWQGLGAAAAVWGAITGTITNQTDLATALDDASETAVWGDIAGMLSDQADLQTALDARQPLDALLTALAALVTAADRLAYFTGVDTVSLTDLTAFARTLLDDANAAAARTTLGLIAGGAGDIWVEKAGDTMTGVLLLPAGTEAAPALAFSDETNLGLIRTATELGVVVSGDRKFIFTHTGGESVFRMMTNGRVVWTNSTDPGGGAMASLREENGGLRDYTNLVSGNSGGAMRWSRAGVVGVAITVITNATGDVTSALSGTFVVSDGAGNTAGGVITKTVPGGTFTLYDDGGTNTCLLQVNADGSVTVQRTAGSRTYAVSLNLVWL